MEILIVTPHELLDFESLEIYGKKPNQDYQFVEACKKTPPNEIRSAYIQYVGIMYKKIDKCILFRYGMITSVYSDSEINAMKMGLVLFLGESELNVKLKQTIPELLKDKPVEWAIEELKNIWGADEHE
jgi:hypothetical protein